MQNQNQNNAPMDKGRVAVVVEKYPTNQVDQRQQPIMKNRYASIGRATLWPSQQNSTAPNVEVELDTMPIGQTGKMKLYIFWDSENPNNQQYQSAQSQQYQNAPQPQQPGQQSWGNKPQGHR